MIYAIMYVAHSGTLRLMVNQYFQINMMIIFLNKLVDSKLKAGELGTIGIILNALKIHINNDKICKQGCNVLWNIIFNG